MPVARLHRSHPLTLLLPLAVCGIALAGGESRPPEIARPLVAWWRFDESSEPTCRDSSGNQHHASPQRLPGGLDRTTGLFGGAVCLTGEHMLRVPAQPSLDSLSAMSISAWIKPTDLTGYREIFRKEDGERRVLFSFQHGGTILSLGLNVNGYVECDAPVNPTQLLDGMWHHCAATFDGQLMRVYLDGTEVGCLKRSGEIAAGGPAPGCIGSSNGGECFQGSVDDLRIYREALTPDEIAGMFRAGVDAMADYTQHFEQKVRAIYAPAGSLAETLATCRQNLHRRQWNRDRELAAILSLRLKADFPEEFQRFVDLTQTTPAEYLVAADGPFHSGQVRRLVELMVEYKPLTERQWQRQTPEQRQKWREAEAIQERFERLEAQGDAARFSPEWIEIALEAGRRIDFRPRVSEAVAPYITPSTPETRSLTSEEAQQVLRRDWLHQANHQPTPERIAREIQWTRQLAARIESQWPDQVDFSRESATLDQLAEQTGQLSGLDRALYVRVRQVKRKIMLGNPVVDFDKVLFVDMPFPQGSEWPHETRHRLGYMAVPGGRLLILDGLSPAGHLQQLMPQTPLHGSFWRPDLSPDASKVLFCFKPHNEKSFHLYQVNVDGTELVQLTDGPYDDLDPIYLPDGQHIVFSTTRGHTYVRCMPPTNAYVLARCDLDGDNIYLISRNNEPDYLPSVMNDGRIIYTRWEYTDKPLWRAQGLWTVNPDGTQVNTLWGNQSVWPDLLKDARSIPGSHRVMFTGSAHHNWFSGSVGIIDPERGLNFPDGLTKITADVEWPESGNGPVDPIESPRYHRSGEYTAYYSPYPLSQTDFLVSANRAGKFLLYLMDVDGNRELIYEGVHNIFHAMPIKARPTPPVIPDRVAWPSREQRDRPEPGVIYSNNVYAGAPSQLAGRARYLRVLSIDHKTYTYWHKRPYLSTGPVVSAVQSEGVKRVLGTVPIEPDGSVAFHAPAGIPLHVQLLDEEYRTLQTMRSFSGVMPGEQRGCLGCHEMHSRAPAWHPSSMALLKGPQPITPPPWSDDTVSFARYVQPVLDQYCGECHQGDGEGRDTLDLTDRPGFLIFSEPYMLLTGRPTWGTPYVAPQDPPPGFGIANTLMVEGYDTRDPAAYTVPEPMTQLSYRSPLIEIASSGDHHGVRVDPISLRRLIVWIDTMCPYRGDQEVRSIDDPVFQGIDWLAIPPRIRTAPRIVRPGPVGP
jgi:hypothetical protein